MHDAIRTEWHDNAPLPEALRLLADGRSKLVRGEPIHAFRIGPLHDRNGKFVVNITDTMLAEIKRVFDLLKGRQRVPIDWNHGAVIGQTPQEAIAYGEVVDLIHLPGQGMWAVPEYTSDGREIVERSEGVLSTSPAFWPPTGWGDVVDKTTGAVIGHCQMIALALTSMPRQDRLQPVHLSETPAPTEAPNAPLPDRHRPQEEAMADTPAAQAPAPGPVATPPPAQPAALADPAADAGADALKAENAALQAKNAELEKAVAELQAKVDQMLAEAQKGAAQLSDSDSAARLLSDRMSGLDKQVGELKARATAAEAKAAAAERDRLLDSHESAGLFTDPERADFALLYDSNRPVFDRFIAARQKNPPVPMNQRHSHSGSVVTEQKSDGDRLNDEIQAVCLRDKVTYPEAYRRVKADPTKADLFGVGVQ